MNLRVAECIRHLSVLAHASDLKRMALALLSILRAWDPVPVSSPEPHRMRNLSLHRCHGQSASQSQLWLIPVALTSLPLCSKQNVALREPLLRSLVRALG